MSVTIWIVGGQFADAELFPALPEGLPLVLVRDPQNPKDPNAVGVCISHAAAVQADVAWPKYSKDRFRLGFLPARGPVNWAALLAPHLDAGRPVTAIFKRHSSRNPVAMQIELSGEAVDVVAGAAEAG